MTGAATIISNNTAVYLSINIFLWYLKQLLSLKLIVINSKIFFSILVTCNNPITACFFLTKHNTYCKQHISYPKTGINRTIVVQNELSITFGTAILHIKILTEVLPRPPPHLANFLRLMSYCISNPNQK